MLNKTIFLKIMFNKIKFKVSVFSLKKSKFKFLSKFGNNKNLKVRIFLFN